jgi:uncharacterized protein (DUF58 family)
MSTEPTTPASGRTGGINRKYLRAQDLRRLSQVFFTGRKPIEGQYSGQHATPQMGQSVEFRDFRQYIPGDEIGSIDWKIYGRSDKLFIKIFEHQADLTVNLLVDASESMAYRGIEQAGRSKKKKSSHWDPLVVRETPLAVRPRESAKSVDEQPHGSKFDQACALAAAIAFLITKQHDRVGFSLAQGGLTDVLAPRSAMAHLLAILDVMERSQPKGEARLADAIRKLAARTGRRELLIVLSDLLEDRDEILAALSMYDSRGGEAILFHVLHADELQLPPVGDGLFIDSETGARLRLNVEDIRTAYDVRLKNFLEGWTRLCKAKGISYSLCSTSDRYDRVLERYLTRRAVRG